MTDRPPAAIPTSAYFDTAFVLKCYLPEADSAPVRAFASAVDDLVTSEFARAEVAAGFHRMLREGRGSAREALAVADQFESDVAQGVWRFVPLGATVWERVRDAFRALPPREFLRSADAIHLASARLAGFDTIHSSDRHLLAAAPRFGLRGVDLTA